MPAKDFFHDAVKNALIKEKWNITHDPYKVKFLESGINLFIDLGAEKVIVAEKEGRKIAIEIKSFLGASWVTDFHNAIGQFMTYRLALKKNEPSRELYLATPLEVYNIFFKKPFIEETLQEYEIKLLIFDPKKEEVVEWKN